MVKVWFDVESYLKEVVEYPHADGYEAYETGALDVAKNGDVIATYPRATWARVEVEAV